MRSGREIAFTTASKMGRIIVALKCGRSVIHITAMRDPKTARRPSDGESASDTTIPVTHGLKAESRREALGHFLRERRETTAPQQVGISSHRGRRTPGLRREEVAFLADIGVKWYARLEAGDDVNPSAATLMGIAGALRLSNAELEYMLELAELRQPSLGDSDTRATAPQTLVALAGGIHGVPATLCDRILTPIVWNDLAEAVYGFSRFKTPVERNGLVRALLDPEFMKFLGTERENLVFRAVGMFRLNYSSPSPSPFAADVYETVKNEPLFVRAWNRRVIAAELTPDGVTVRNHPVVGRLEMYGVDLGLSIRSDLLFRIMAPASEETAWKFERLEDDQHNASARERALVRLHLGGGP
jgi:transcriptional regulator with XRE-family HTH domain